MFTPNTPEDQQEMLAKIGVSSIQDLLQQIPPEMLYPSLDLPQALTDFRSNTAQLQL